MQVLRARSTEVAWERPIALLFIDGLHYYDSVRGDFRHFAPFLIAGGLVAFHDYVWYCPDVRRFVNELLAAGELVLVAQRDSLILFRSCGPA